jgi:coproporphyrinogen III oxidase-like Fe-S oxidoreductase
MLGLRTAEGIDLDQIRRRYGVEVLAPGSERIEGLLKAEGGRLVPTLEGWAVADTLARSFEMTR